MDGPYIPLEMDPPGKSLFWRVSFDFSGYLLFFETFRVSKRSFFQTWNSWTKYLSISVTIECQPYPPTSQFLTV
ncbi:unnamed protein product [Caenorhabditis nigoni]